MAHKTGTTPTETDGAPQNPPDPDPRTPLFLTACETMQGLGRDVETTGEVIQSESVDSRKGM